MSAPALEPSRTADGPGDEQRRRDLRRMRGLATSLLVLAAIVYAFTRDLDGFWGYVNAGAEASMVGAVADWFAVTALFRHPLGLPVPHTALIPKRKAELGRSLQDFVTDNFLVEDVVRDRVLAATPARQAGQWLSSPDHARRVVSEGAALLDRALERLPDDEVRAVVEQVILPRLRREPVAPLLGALLEQVVRERSHVGVVDLVLDEGIDWLRAHEETFTDVVSDRAPWWAPERLNEVVIHRLYVEVVSWLEDIRRDPHHHARYALDSMLGQVAHDLVHDEGTQARAERLKERLFDEPQLVTTGMAVWGSLRRTLRGALDDEEGLLRSRLVAEVGSWAERLCVDAALQERLDRRVADTVVYLVQRYGAELTSVITTTVERWDGEEAAARIELHVGRDLQFIRINGTVVGGLVGVAIHALGTLLP